MQEGLNQDYFKQGLSYFISGVNLCLSKFQNFEKESKVVNRFELFKVVKDLQEKINSFCSSHLKEQTKQLATTSYEANHGSRGQQNESEPNFSTKATKVENKAIQVAEVKKKENPMTNIPIINPKVLKNLTEKVEDLHKAHLKFSHKNVREMTLQVEGIRNEKQNGIIGTNFTHIAIKSLNSFMMGTKGKGIKIVEKDYRVYGAKLPLGNVWLTDIIYVKHLDCYFIAYNDQLFRKDINKENPYLFMEVKCGVRVGACFRNSDVNERLIIAKDAQSICAVDLERKELAVEVAKSLGGEIYDFRLFGKGEDRVVAVTRDGYILLYHLDYKKKMGSILSNYKFELLEERKEMGFSIAVCDKDKYIFVEIGQAFCTRVAVLQIDEYGISLRANIDQYKERMGLKLSFECFGYVGNHILVVGLEKKKPGQAQVYDYDTDTGYFRELRDKRVSSSQVNPVKLHRLGNEFYYTGDRGNILKLSVNI